MNQERVGRFSSSSIYKLTALDKKGGFGKPALTYIQEKQWEMLLGRELVSDKDTRPTSWGLHNEQRVFDLLPLEYRLEIHKRYFHKDNAFWCGSPDIVAEDFCGDIKCTWSLKSFCEGVDSFGNIEKFKDVKPEWYWQIVSNCILTEKKHGEIVIYCPYKKELKEIKDDANQSAHPAYAFISFLDDEQLPYLHEGGFYKNLNQWRFEIPLTDIEFLTQRVTEATALVQGIKK